jgi:soluble lytic murein transglycosylase-like protein
MSRFFCVFLVSLGLAAPVGAQVPDAARAPASEALAVASASSAATAATAATAPSASAVGAAQPEASAARRVTSMLTARFGLARARAEQIASAVFSSASKYSLPPELVLAVISIESRFKATARGAHGATGLMQVVPAAHKRLVKGVDLTEPAANIEAGSAILHGYLEAARGDLTAALKSYGGSLAYAQKVSTRAKDFEPGVGAAGAASSVSAAATATTAAAAQ